MRMKLPRGWSMPKPVVATPDEMAAKIRAARAVIARGGDLDGYLRVVASHGSATAAQCQEIKMAVLDAQTGR
jgi:uncharacterized protein YdbL (DUF1318 family)